MDDDGGKRVQSGDEDWLSNLPECLLFKVLLNLDTKDVVKLSVLSSRWRNLWKFVPGLDLEYRDFPDYDTFESFVDTFLGFNSDSCIQDFKFCFERNADGLPELRHCTQWINTVVDRKVQHLHVMDGTWEGFEVEIPPTVYMCESLVSLKLFGVNLADTDSVFLPCLKNIDLDVVDFANDSAFELLISGCPVLESLTICKSACDNVRVLRVRSQSLLRFTLFGHDNEDMEEDQVVEIDAPMLKYLYIYDHETDSFIVNNLGSLVNAHINILFNFSFKKPFDPYDLPKRNMIRKFLIAISTVKVMTLDIRTLQVIYNYSSFERLPLFPNLSSLHVQLFDNKWYKLPIFLESCPNLKSLTLD